MSKHLILITGYFPYSTQETFLESEIIELAKCFDQILILPSKITGKKRPLPSNVNIDTSFAEGFSSQANKVKSLFSPLFIKGLLFHKKYAYKSNAIRRINSFVNDAILTKKWLSNNCPSSDTVIYTYWLNGKTFGAELFKEEFPGVKVVSRAHRYDLYDYWFSPPFWPFRQSTLDMLDRLYLISNDGLQFLKNNYQIDPSKVTVSKLGVYPTNNLTQKSTDSIIRLVSVSGLIGMKRVDLIAEYLCKYSKENKAQSFHWTHMGDGPLKEKIVGFLDSNAPENLNYDFKGQVKNTEVFEFYTSNPVDLFINLSESEGLPVSIMEAQANGIFVAAPDVGGVKEIVSKEVGHLLPENPSYLDFKDLMKILKSSKLSPVQIQSFCNTHYNAETNYLAFAKDLKSLD